MDYQAIVHSIIDSLVDHPESIMIRELPSEEDSKDVTILICAEKDDTARLIGRRGTVANAIREVMSIAGKSEGKRIHLKFESFENEED